MRIAILSDTHDNIHKLDPILPLLATADGVIHCGDLCSPFIVVRLGKLAVPVHVVWGNNEGDIRLICEKAQQAGNIHLHGAFAELEFDGVKVAVNHYPEIARSLAKSGAYDLVCYGHDHVAHHSRVGACDLVNPGELLGLLGKTSFAWFNTATRTVEFVEVC